MTERDENNDKPSRLLRKASRDGKTESCLKALLEGANINSQDQRGWSAIHLATSRNKIEVVKLLISKGADVNLQTKELSTPLVVAAYNGRYEICKLLLDNGANPSIIDHVGDTPLVIAKQRKNRAVEQLLETVVQDNSSSSSDNNNCVHDNKRVKDLLKEKDSNE